MTISSLMKAAVLVALACLPACKTSPPVPDYEKFYAQAPFTVVVPPVRNQTADAEAPRFFLATMTKPLVDRGYYVIPVEVTSEILAAEGLDEGALDGVVPKSYADYFGADAVLFVTLTKWDTVYAVLASSVSVAMEYRLVSTRTGEVLWQTAHEQVIQSSSGGGAGLGALVAAAINAAATAAGTDYVPMAMKVNRAACKTLPSGPYSSKFEEEKQMLLARARERRAASEGETKGSSGSSGSNDW